MGDEQYSVGGGCVVREGPASNDGCSMLLMLSGVPERPAATAHGRSGIGGAGPGEEYESGGCAEVLGY